MASRAKKSRDADRGGKTQSPRAQSSASETGGSDSEISTGPRAITLKGLRNWRLSFVAALCGTSEAQKLVRLLRVWPLEFFDQEVEIIYLSSIRSTYTARLVIIGLLYGATHALVWLVYGICFGQENLLYMEKSVLVLFHLSFFIGIICSLVMASVKFFNCTARHSTAILYGGTQIPYLTWNVVQLIGSLQSNSATALDKIDFKLYTDGITIFLYAVILVIYDQLIQTCVKQSVYAHLALIAQVFIIGIIQIVKLTSIDKNTRIVTCILQIIFFTILTFLAFFGRYLRELAERCIIFASTLDQMKLKIMKEQQERRLKSQGETVLESIIFELRNASNTLQEATSEDRAARDDPRLVDTRELLKEVVEMLTGTDLLFSSEQGEVEESDNDEDRQERQFMSLYAGARARRRAPGIGAPDLRKSRQIPVGVDVVYWQSISSEPVYLTGARFPVDEFKWKYSTEERVGRDPELSILEMSTKSKHVLVETGCRLLRPYLKEELQIEEETAQRYFYLLELTYRPNPYHSPTHGAMVAHMAVCITRLVGVYERLRPLQQVALIVAGLGHDVGHAGKNNAFYISWGCLVTLVYNDQSPLEMYHSFVSNRLYQIGLEVNIFQKLTESDYRAARREIIDLILVTDMAQHFSSISRFRVRRSSPQFDFLNKDDDRWQVICLCMKMADLSHGFVEWPQHLEWSLRVTEEFYQQGELEKSLNLPVSPLCDRSSHDEFAKSQNGFIQYVVLPLANELTGIDQSGAFGNRLVTKLLFNKHKWLALKDSDSQIPIPDHIREMKTAPAAYVDLVVTRTFRARNVRETCIEVTSIKNQSKIEAHAKVTEERKDFLQARSMAANEEGEIEEEAEEEEEEEEVDEDASRIDSPDQSAREYVEGEESLQGPEQEEEYEEEESDEEEQGAELVSEESEESDEELEKGSKSDATDSKAVAGLKEPV